MKKMIIKLPIFPLLILMWGADCRQPLRIYSSLFLTHFKRSTLPLSKQQTALLKLDHVDTIPALPLMCQLSRSLPYTLMKVGQPNLVPNLNQLTHFGLAGMVDCDGDVRIGERIKDLSFFMSLNIPTVQVCLSLSIYLN